MGLKYLIDTNILIYYLTNGLDEEQERQVSLAMDHHFWVSVISEIEFLGFSGFRENSSHFKLALNFLNHAYIYPLTPPIVKQTIQLKQEYKIKTPDAIIAATALTHTLTLITRNTDDFKMIPHLQLLNPFV